MTLDGNRVSSADIVTKLLDDRAIVVRLTPRVTYFSLFQSCQTGSAAHTASSSMGDGNTPPGCEADQPHQNSTEVKNVWSYTSTPPIRLHGVGKDIIAFLYSTRRFIAVSKTRHWTGVYTSIPYLRCNLILY
jgi:hypothetical protein